MKRLYFILITVVVLMALACGKTKNIFPQIKIGQTKNQIKEIFGEPYEINLITKNQEHIWGPQEDFWHQIPKGSKIVIWQYNERDGYILLYFIDGSNHLSYKVFAPKGVTYESSK